MVVVTSCPPLKLIYTCTRHSFSLPQGGHRVFWRTLLPLTCSEAASPQISNPSHLSAFAPLAFQQTQGPLHLEKRNYGLGSSFSFLLFRANFVKACVCPTVSPSMHSDT